MFIVDFFPCTFVSSNEVRVENGEDQFDQSFEKRRSITKSEGGKKYLTNNKKKKANWICHMLRRNCLLKHVVEGKIEARVKVKGR